MSDPSPCTLALDVLPEIGAALIHAGVPALRELRLANRSERRLVGAHLDLVADPPFAPPLRIDLPPIEPGASRDLAEAHPLALDAAWLSSREEGERGTVSATLWQGETRLAQARVDVRLLAPAHWPGVGLYPELIACWVRPNARALIPLLAEADRLLDQATGRAGLDGLQSRDPKRAWHIAQAVYRAVQARDLRYVDPPASFEEAGQRVRGHDEVLAGLGTCLDLTTLLAACIEQCGLHPLVVVVDGHAFPGAWLTEFSLTSPVTDDGALLRKRVALGEAVVFDSSAVTQGVPFADAARLAESQLADPTALRALIDVRACRVAGIRPMALEPMTAPPPAQDVTRPLAPAADAPAERFVVDEVDPGVRTRLDAWRSRLLDLSLRNRLLNLRETRHTVRAPHLDLPALGAALHEGRSFKVQARGDQRLAEAEQVSPDRVRDAQESGTILLDMTERELSTRLTELFRRSRSSLDESGAHTLYLAMGVLRWFEAESAEAPRTAPLLLVPVELRRRGVGQFELSRSEDEPAVNATLLEKLRREFGVDTGPLESLQADEQGLDVARVLRRARVAVKEIARWDVLDEAWLGQFSFTKHLMWLDLGDNLDALLKSPVVAHLFAGGGQAYPLSAPLVALENVDTDRDPEALLPVVPADPSQLQAVIAARDGSSFVLQGPPGTGKSQTITNLIAQILAEGRTVLFVSEKRAALEVVQRRLTAIGLGPYCLELHSHQSNKREVVRQLGASFTAAAQAPQVGWQAHAQELAKTRQELDAHAARLAATAPFGGTVRDVVAELVGLREVPRVDLPDLDPASLDGQGVADRDERVRRAVARVGEIGDPAAHPWSFVERSTWTPDWAREAEKHTRSARDAAAALRDSAQKLQAQLSAAGLPAVPETAQALDAFSRLARALQQVRPLPAALRDEPDLDTRLDEIDRWIANGRRLSAGRTRLFQTFGPDILELPLEGLRATFARWAKGFFLFAWFALFGPRRQLQAVARAALPDRTAMPGELDRAIEVRNGLQAFHDIADRAQRWIGPLWRGADTDFDELDHRLSALRAALVATGKVAHLCGVRPRDLVVIHAACTDPEALPPALAEALGALPERVDAYLQARTILNEHLHRSHEPPTISAEIDVLNAALRSPQDLRAWCAARAALDALVEAGLAPLEQGLLHGELALSRLEGCWARSAREAWWEHHLRSEPSLATFRGVEHAERITRFADLDEEGLSLARAEVAARVADRVPDLHGPGDDLGLVRRQLQLQRNHLPVRKLFARIGPVLKRIKPCALMSPLSVAQYLDPSLPGYDVVVFDEASQIPPWDAIGAIARGTSVIVVGDSKQLPPTSFFESSGDEEEVDEEEVAETESILDEVVAAGLRQLRLRWHYRSEHESLIAFSNHQYYDNELFTFPSAVREGLGVELRPVPEGYYDRGRSRTNRGEAEAVVAELIRLIELPDEIRPSVGVVTFSMAQQRLVQDLIDEHSQSRPALQHAFSEDLPEPAFVKNLESVQGDERDVMLFTIGYGPDRAGKVTMNFGPLNRRGGERRLNVAVTRARQRLVVFSTLRADQIDLLRTRAVGVAHLKLFLAYAEEGVAALDRAIQVDAAAGFDSPFEREVHQVLTEAGYRVDTQVGVSGYRIDLAVVDPEAPGRYLLAIECDGATYHSARGARERDRLRQAVLENLGWRFHRVWSTDWWYERRSTVERLLQAVAEAVAAPREARPRPAPVVEIPTESHASVPDPVAQLGDEVPEAPWPDRASEWEGLPELPPADGEAFYTETERPRVAEALRTLAEAAGPISLDEAYRAVIAAYGFGRLGKRIRAVLDEAPGALPPERAPRVYGDHLWPASTDPHRWDRFRYVDQGPSRDVASIAPEELAAAAAWVLERGVSMSRDALAREVARIFGAAQLGRQIRQAIDNAIELMEQKGLAQPIDEDRLRWGG